MKKSIKTAFSLLLLVAATSCGTQRHEISHIESSDRYIVHNVRDSIIIRDSIFVRESADTVHLTHYRTLYRDRLHTDTLWLTDTVTVVKELFLPQPDDKGGLKRILKIAFLLFVFFVLWRMGLFSFIRKLIDK